MTTYHGSLAEQLARKRRSPVGGEAQILTGAPRNPRLTVVETMRHPGLHDINLVRRLVGEPDLA